MSTLEREPEEARLSRTISDVLRPFTGRALDDSLLLEMVDALNQGLASFRAGRRIKLALDGPAIRVEVVPEEANEKAGLTPRAAVVGFDAVSMALAA